MVPHILYAIRSSSVVICLCTAVFLFCPPLQTHANQQPAGTIRLTPEERAWLKAHPVITLAPDPDFKPIEYFDKNGSYQGAAADVIRILEKKLGITITIAHLKNWDEAMAKFTNHEVDLLGAMVRTPNREKFALFSDTLVAVPGGIFARSGTPTNLTLKDLKGKKVAVVSNYAAHDIIRNKYPEISLEVVPDISTGLAKASLGMVDAYVENMANATFYSQEAGITNLQVAGKTEFDYRWGIGIRKDWPELQGILNKGLAAISEEERNRAIHRWIFIEGQHWHPTKTFVIGSVAASLGFLLLIVIYWNYSLRKVVRNRTASLQQELEERHKAENALKALAGQLEERVRARTEELEKEVSERINSEQAANVSEQRFRELFQNIADPIYIADMAGKIIAANDQACQELGYSLEELLQLHIHDVDASDDVSGKFAVHCKHLATETPVRFESVHLRKDGSEFQVELNVRLIDFAGRQALIGVARNISERKQAEEERRNLERQVLHAQKLESMGVLAGGIAHDFNNILTTIIGNADLALMRINPESPVVDHLRRIEQAAARAADLARQMLAYSGRGKFIIEAIDLNLLVEEMTHMLAVSISKKAILSYNFTRPLPSVEADATQIRQIIMNLIINASEAIGDQSGIIAITTGCANCDRAYLKEAWLDEQLPEGLYVFLEIADTGCGMDRDTIARVFDPFFTTKFTGRGLGMAAVLGIVRGHKGAIKVYSEPGKGTTFKVLFPACDRPKELFNGDANPLSGWKGDGVILLVDDEESILGIVSEMLRELGFEVLTALDGRQALEIFESNRERIACVILDLTMPHMDGEQAFRELRRISPDVRVIISSGYNEQEVTQKFIGKGLAGFIQKPYKLSELGTKLREIVQ